MGSVNIYTFKGSKCDIFCFNSFLKVSKGTNSQRKELATEGGSSSHHQCKQTASFRRVLRCVERIFSVFICSECQRTESFSAYNLSKKGHVHQM